MPVPVVDVLVVPVPVVDVMVVPAPVVDAELDPLVKLVAVVEDGTVDCVTVTEVKFVAV